GGTPLYASPEQSAHLLGEHDAPALDGRSDLYSFGVLLFQALTGELPLHGDRPPREMLRAHLTESPKRMRSVVPSAPKSLDEFVDRCLRKPPDQRWKSATEARRALERIVSPPKRGLLVAWVVLLLAVGTTAVIMATRRPPFPLAIAQEDVVLYGQSQPTRGAPASLPVAVDSDEWSVALETSDLRWPAEGVTVEVIDPADGALLPIEATYPKAGTVILRSSARSVPTERDWFQLRVRKNGSERLSQSYRVHWLAPPSKRAVAEWIDRWTFRTPATESSSTEAWPPEEGVRVPPAGVPTWRRAKVTLDGTLVSTLDLTAALPSDLPLASYLESQPLGQAPRDATWSVTVENLVGQRTTQSRATRLAPVQLAVTGTPGEPHAGFVASGVDTAEPSTVRPRRLGVIVSPGGAELWAHLNRPGRVRIHVDGLATGEGREVVVRVSDGELRAPVDAIFPGLADGAYEWSIQPVDEYRPDSSSAATIRGSFEWRTRVPRLDLLTSGGVITPGVTALRSRALDPIAVQFGGLARRIVFDARYQPPSGAAEKVMGLVLEPGADPVVLPFRIAAQGEHRIALEVRNDERDPQPFEVAEYTITVDDRPPTVAWPTVSNEARRTDDGIPMVRASEFRPWTVRVDDDGQPVAELAVEVNGRAVSVSTRDTRWPLRTWLDANEPDGPQTVRVRATDAFGNTTEQTFSFHLSRRAPTLEDRTGTGAWPVQSVSGEESWVRRWAFAVSTSDRDVERVTAHLTIPTPDPAEPPLVVSFPLEERDGLFRPSRTSPLSRANVPPGWADREVTIRIEAVDRGGNTAQLIRTRRVAGRDALPLPTWFAVGDRTLVRIDPHAAGRSGAGYEFGGRRREQEFPHLNYVVPPERVESYYLATRPEPETGLSWNEANDRAQSLGGRLPSWLEWEFAIRGGKRYWPQYRESVLLGPDGRSLAATAEWTRSPWIEGTPRERRQTEALELMAFGQQPPSNRAVVVRDAFDRFEPIAIEATTTHGGSSISFRLTLGLVDLDRSLERTWGLR
ncbi:MAG: SUMF1/EgtB/PvdO family nonheme iron enzyme, partial [Planctomycetota bacterium]